MYINNYSSFVFTPLEKPFSPWHLFSNDPPNTPVHEMNGVEDQRLVRFNGKLKETSKLGDREILHDLSCSLEKRFSPPFPNLPKSSPLYNFPSFLCSFAAK